MRSIFAAALSLTNAFAQSTAPPTLVELDALRTRGKAAVPELLAGLRLEQNFACAREDARLLLVLAAMGPEAREALPRLLERLDEGEAPWEFAERLPELLWTVGELARFDARAAAAVALVPPRPDEQGARLMGFLGQIAGYKTHYGVVPDEATLREDLGSSFLLVRVAAGARVRDLPRVTPATEAALRTNFWAAWQVRRDYALDWHEPRQWLLVETALSLLAVAQDPADTDFARIAALRHPSPWQRRRVAEAMMAHGVRPGWALRDVLPALQDPDPVVVHAVVQAISSTAEGESAVAALAAMDARDDSKLDHVRVAAIRRLRAAGQRSGSDDPATALHQALFAGVLSDAALAPATLARADPPALFEALRFASPEQGEVLLQRVAELGPAANQWPGLLACLEATAVAREGFHGASLAATIAAVTVDPHASEVDLLARCTGDTNAAARLRAVQALAARDTLQAATQTALVQALSAPQPRRFAVGSALGRTRSLDPECTGELELAIARLVARLPAVPHAPRAEAAARLLRDGDADDGLFALRTLGALDVVTPAVDELIATLASSRDEPVLLAITALQRAGAAASAALPRLQELARAEDDVARAAAAAVRAITAALPSRR